MAKENSKVVQTAQGPVEYVKFGPAPFIFYVPGGEGGVDGVSEEFMKSTHQDRGVGVISYSRPGYRRTPLSSGKSWAEQADLMALLLEALGIKSVVVCGRSGGGPVAVHFAARHPGKCAALMLLYANQYPVGGHSKSAADTRNGMPWNKKLLYWCSSLSVNSWVNNAKPPTDPKVREYYVDGMLQAMSDFSAEERAEEKARLMAGDPLLLKCITEFLPVISLPFSARHLGTMNDHVLLGWDMKLPFDKVDCTTLYIHGKRDNDNPFGHSEYGAKQIKGAKLIALDMGYHACEFCKEFPPAWEEALAMIKASKAAEPAVDASSPTIVGASMQAKE